jgi:hypothetical protein
VGQRQSGYQRQPDEDYATPPWVVQVAAQYLRKHCPHIWAPADKESSPLVLALRAAGFSVIATADDFLLRNSVPYPRVDAVVTNPPFGTGGKLACQFIAHALELVPIVALLLRIDFDSGKTRAGLFRDCRAFAHKIVLLDRIVWFEREGAPGPSENHCWMIWNAQHRGAATISYASKSDCGEESRSSDQIRSAA